MSKRWVQHISGQGEKWEVHIEYVDGYETAHHWRLPKSEYIICEPPERWMDVTERVTVEDYCEYSQLCCDGKVVKTHDGSHRLRKVRLMKGFISGMQAGHEVWAFVVERKEPT